MTTEEEFKIIERIAALCDFVVRPATEFSNRVVTDQKDKGRSAFWWDENEGFDEFILQIAQYKHDRGYETASRW